MDNQVTDIAVSPEFIGAVITAVVSTLSAMAWRVYSAVNTRVIDLERDIASRDETLKDRAKDLNDNQVLLSNIQNMYNQTLQQITDLNKANAQGNADIGRLQKQLGEVNAVILDQQNQIKKYMEEIHRLQPFEKLAHERNGEIKKLTERLTELERKYDLEIAKRQGGIEALQALDLVPIAEKLEHAESE